MEDEQKQHEGLAVDPEEIDNSMGWDGMDADLGILLADGYEDAFIGTAYAHNEVVALYDADKCVQILVDRDGMTEEEALEYFNYNTIQAYVGPRTPIYAVLRRPDEQRD